jgi:hypothetical protein
MEGKSQSLVASMFEVSQPTISRIVQRYERWQAHASERAGGRLDDAERLRFQRWLTFERNEVILANCLRIANEMEGFTGVSKSTIRRPSHAPSRETEIRTEHSQIDRSGIAARFLRLAFQINMQQLKLAERDPAPAAEPLSAEEVARQAREAAADLAALASAEHALARLEAAREILCDDLRDDGPLDDGPVEEGPVEEGPVEDARLEDERLEDERRDEGSLDEGPEADSFRGEPQRGQPAIEPAECDAIGCALNGGGQGMHTVNNVHNAHPAKLVASPCSCISCNDHPGAEKIAPAPWMDGAEASRAEPVEPAPAPIEPGAAEQASPQQPDGSPARWYGESAACMV